MNFRQKNNFSTKNIKKATSISPLLVVLCLIIIFSFSFSRNLLFTFAKPLWNIKDGIVSFVKDNHGILKSKVALLQENDALKKQLDTFNKEQALSDITKKENDDLKTILGRKPGNQKEILAAVLVKPFLSPYDTLVIDVGTHDGVSVGNRVLADGNTYIGTISEIYADTAKVTLYSSPGEKTKVLIGHDVIEKEALGLGGGNFSVEMPRESGVQEGDSIVIPSISVNIFSTIEKINFTETDSFQTVLFKSPVNIAQLQWVEVIASSQK